MQKILGVVYLFALTAVLTAEAFFLYDYFSNPDSQPIQLVTALTPLIFMIGVSIALATLWHYEDNERREISSEQSKFFYDECLQRMEAVLTCLEARRPIHEYADAGNVNLTPARLQEVFFNLTEIRSLSDKITAEAYCLAFQRRKAAFLEQLANLLAKLPVASLSGFTWPGPRPVMHVLNEYNEYVREQRRRARTGAERAAFKASFWAHRDDTPFSNGLSPKFVDDFMQVLTDLAEGLDCDRGTTRSRHATEMPFAFSEYRNLCAKLDNVDGELRLKRN